MLANDQDAAEEAHAVITTVRAEVAERHEGDSGRPLVVALSFDDPLVWVGRTAAWITYTFI